MIVCLWGATDIVARARWSTLLGGPRRQGPHENPRQFIKNDGDPVEVRRRIQLMFENHMSYGSGVAQKAESEAISICLRKLY
ncbi:hypothetical protein NDU88_001591 [Pleurodeles waltl]|uniref:Uncharacterized protein n=1 Tax=Pleurodeles waltl TaxID=8319 RepID=A0AAV7RBA9_PLEWA|nr:hypothetical protein NDU88_001591 [Pleurodeles waltl]